MVASLKARMPFFDARSVAFVFALPDRFRAWFQYEVILRQAMKTFASASTLRRPR